MSTKNDVHEIKNEEIEYEFVKKKKRFFPIIIILLLSVVIGLVVINKDLIINQFKRTGNNLVNETETIVNKDFMTGLRLVSMDRFDEAISYFDKLNFEKMSESDQEIILMTYLNNGDAEKVLELNPNFEDEIIKHYLKNGEMVKLKDLETDSKIIEFEIAILDNDYERIIELKDVEGLIKDYRRGNAIANAYYQIGETEEALNYTSLMVLDGINMWQPENTETKTLTLYQFNKPSYKGLYVINITTFIVVLFMTGIFAVFMFKNKSKESPSKEKQEDPKHQENEDKPSDDIQKEGTAEAGEDDKYSYYYEDE